MQLNDQDVKLSVDSLTFAMEIHIFQTYLGIKLIRAHSLSAKNGGPGNLNVKGIGRCTFILFTMKIGLGFSFMFMMEI